MAEVDLVLGNDEKLKAESYRADGLRRARSRQRARQRHHGGAGDRRASGRRHRRAHARLRAGAERLRPSLHLLHHPLWPRQFALGADGRGRRADPAPRRKRLSRDGADRRRHHLLRADLPGTPRSAIWCSRSCGTCRTCSGCGSPRSTRSRPTRHSDDAIADERRLMPHLHLSLQSGDDMILKRMKRRHCAPMRCVRAPRCARLRPGHGVRRRHHRRLSDRDRRDVRELAALVAEARLTYLHVFPYSPRPGTPAARMPQVDRKPSPRTAPPGCGRSATRQFEKLATSASARSRTSWSNTTAWVARAVPAGRGSRPAQGQIVPSGLLAPMPTA